MVFEDLFATRAAAIDAIEAGAASVDRLRDPFVGPTDEAAMSFPAVEVLPESADDQGGNAYRHTLRLNIYFERKRGVDYRTQLDAAGEAAVAATGELLAGIDEAYAVRIGTVEDFAGNAAGTQLLLISIQFVIDVTLDLPSA